MAGDDRHEDEQSGVALTWRLQATGGDQARRSLNLADIVAAAMAIADEEGLAEISMAKIAKRLGYSTMALYRHVPGKPELIELMFDAGVGAPDDDTLVPGDWRESLARMARQMSAMYRGRRWILDIPISGPPASPNNLLWLETGLQALRDTPLSVQERAACVAIVASFIRGNERLLAELGAGRQGVAAQSTYGAVLRQFLPKEAYPETAKAIDAGIFDDDSFDDDVQFGLDRVLDGIQVLIDSRSSTSDPR